MSFYLMMIMLFLYNILIKKGKNFEANLFMSLCCIELNELELAQEYLDIVAKLKPEDVNVL